jgi:hypothetical protein
LEVAVDSAVAGVVCVIDPVTQLAVTVLGTPVTTVVPEANIAAAGDDDEASRQLAAQPAQRVPVADGDADLVSEDIAIAVGHIEFDLETIYGSVDAVVVPLGKRNGTCEQNQFDLSGDISVHYQHRNTPSNLAFG